MSGEAGDRKVAVIIPTHDRAGMVVEAVESALRQTAPCRVVVADDGSTDDTLERLAVFGDRVTVLALENRERGAARNAGARAAADAEVLCFLDADDLLRPEHVARVGEALRAHPGAVFVTTDARLVDAELRPLGRMTGGRSGPVTLEAFLLGREPVPPTTTAVRREAFEAVGGFDERRELAGSEDWLLVAELLRRGEGRRVGDATALIRKHVGNTMADAARMERTVLLAHRLFFRGGDDERGRDPGDLPEELEEASRARLLLNASTQHYAGGRMGEARSLLRRAARADVGVVLEPKWGWTFLRTLLGRSLSAGLRAAKRWMLKRLP